MKKTALILALCVGISSGVRAQPDASSWWSNRWMGLVTGFLLGGLFLYKLDNLDGYFKKRLEAKSDNVGWNTVALRPKVDELRLDNKKEVSINTKKIELQKILSDDFSKHELPSSKFIGGSHYYESKNRLKLWKENKKQDHFHVYFYNKNAGNFEADDFLLTDSFFKVQEKESSLKLKQGTVKYSRWSDSTSRLETEILGESNIKQIQGSFLLHSRDSAITSLSSTAPCVEDVQKIPYKNITVLYISSFDTQKISVDFLSFVFQKKIKDILPGLKMVVIVPLFLVFVLYNRSLLKNLDSAALIYGNKL